jgi:Ser/Thr protein kinase RdoA (MazF antagonist)
MSERSSGRSLESSEEAGNHLHSVAARFQLPGRVTAISPLGHGNVNDTFLLLVEDGRAEQRFVLQRVNTKVFHEPRLVMQNMLLLGEHVGQKLQGSRSPRPASRWEVPRVVRARGSGDPWLEEGGSFWRTLTFLEDCQSFDTITDADHGREVGYGLAMFHHMISDLPASTLADTLAGFHITPTYLSHYEQVLKTRARPQGHEVEYGMAFVDDRRDLTTVLERAKAEGRLTLRPIHGDPKINNMMVDNRTGKVIGLVDLDTVKPGLIHYDIGDCLRSGCNRLGEEATDPGAVSFDVDLCGAILEGYLSVGHAFLSEADYTYLFDSIRLIAFELGLRFFTDHLAGNVYFKTTHPGQNLQRALVQFRLTESIEAQESAIRAHIERVR